MQRAGLAARTAGMGRHGRDGTPIRGGGPSTLDACQSGSQDIVPSLCSAERADLADQMGISRAAGPLSQCRSLPLRTT